MLTGNEPRDRQIAALVLALAGLSQLNILGNVTSPILGFNLFGISLSMVVGVLLLVAAWKVMKTGKITGRMA